MGLGAEVLFFPVIEIQPPLEWAPADAALESLTTYDWIVFTSRNAVEQLRSRLTRCSIDISVIAGLRVAAIGAATSDALKAAGIHVDVMPDCALASAIPDSLGGINGLRILLPRSDVASAELPQALRNRGASVDEVTVYRTMGSDGSVALAECVRGGGLDAITFASASAVRSFAESTRRVELPDWSRDADRPRIVVIGPVTAATATDLNIPVDAVAVTHDAHGLAQAVVDALCTTPFPYSIGNIS